VKIEATVNQVREIKIVSAAVATICQAIGATVIAVNDVIATAVVETMSRSDRGRDRDSDQSRDRDDRSSRSDRDRDSDRGSRDESSGSSRKKEGKEKRHERSGRTKPSVAWDVPPAGFESISAAQYKTMLSTGRIVQGPGAAEQLTPMGPPSQATRQSRRLYVGNIPFGVTEPEMKDFFNRQMQKQRMTTQPGEPINQVQINQEKNFAFLEFRSVEETTNALTFDGISLNGQALKLKRPKDYAPLPGQGDLTSMGMNIPTECPTRLLLSGVPTTLKEEQIRELVSAFGTVVELTLVADMNTGEFKGHVYCEYTEPTMAEQAIMGLNDLPIGETKLVVQRAVMAPTMVAPISLPPCTKVLLLMNMVADADLADDEDYQDICEDVKEECSKYGTVVSQKIPRSGPGKGKIFMEFTLESHAQTCAAALAGRKFAQRTVAASFISEQAYMLEEFGD